VRTLKRTIPSCILILLPLILFAETTVRLLPEVEVKGGKVRLGQIARIETENETMGEKLRDVAVTSAPRPGKSRRITRAHVEAMIERGGIDPKSIKIEGDSVLVRTSYQRVEAKRLMKAIEEFLRERAGSIESKVSILPTTPLKDLSLPTGEVSISVRSISKDPLRGWFRAILRVDGEVVEEVPIFAKVKVEKEVVVAVKPIGAGERISADKVTVKRMMIGPEEGDALGKVEDVLGKICSRSIAKGSPIRRSSLRLPVIVRRGDLVKIVARYGLIRITARGKAVENGRLGDLIEVENLNSKRRIHAEVVSPGVVMVNLGGIGDEGRQR
jgi:flagella basal body P-ring formation protein FlgA